MKLGANHNSARSRGSREVRRMVIVSPRGLQSKVMPGVEQRAYRRAQHCLRLRPYWVASHYQCQDHVPGRHGISLRPVLSEFPG